MKHSHPKLLLLFSLCTLLGLTACDDPDPEQNAGTGSVELAIQGMIADNNLALESATYDASSAEEGFRLSRISFFLSDLRLVQLQNGRSLETPLAEVAYFNMGPSGLDSEIFDNIPTGDYTSLKFNFGLTEEQDMTNPADYSQTHPLGQESEYWVNWGSYIFAKIEGKTDTLPDGAARFDAPFVFHVGVAAENSRPGEVAINLPLRAGSNDLSLELDIATLMQLNKSNELPLTEFDHGGRFAEQIVTNAIAAFRVAE